MSVKTTATAVEAVNEAIRHMSIITKRGGTLNATQWNGHIESAKAWLQIAESIKMVNEDA